MEKENSRYTIKISGVTYNLDEKIELSDSVTGHEIKCEPSWLFNFLRVQIPKDFKEKSDIAFKRNNDI